MHTNTDRRNNPLNPLQKAASLNIEKVVEDANPSFGRIHATLTFKKSASMHGRTTDVAGNGININFSMAIHRASFSLKFYNSEGNPSGNNIRILDIAFQTALVHEVELHRKGETKNSGVIECEASVAAKAELSSTPRASVAAGITASGKKSHSSANTETTNLKSTKLNISSTIGAGMIDWEIYPNEIHATSSHDHLEGSVFLVGSENIPACKIEHAKGNSIKGISVEGSVRASMTDLIVGDINFADDDGNIIPVENIEKPARALGVFKAKSNEIEIKNRITKSIIRKHLETQNMICDGTQVEICRASD